MSGRKREPIIYHGYTLTTKLPFNKVIQTIKVKKHGATSISHSRVSGALLANTGQRGVKRGMRRPIVKMPGSIVTWLITRECEAGCLLYDTFFFYTSIQDYAFTSSNFPVVVSTENHCNKTQQAKMAAIFRDIFKDMLPKEDLVELEGRERLPSPQELQGKIILKGSYTVSKSTKCADISTNAVLLPGHIL